MKQRRKRRSTSECVAPKKKGFSNVQYANVIAVLGFLFLVRCYCYSLFFCQFSSSFGENWYDRDERARTHSICVWVALSVIERASEWVFISVTNVKCKHWRLNETVPFFVDYSVGLLFVSTNSNEKINRKKYDWRIGANHNNFKCDSPRIHVRLQGVLCWDIHAHT